MLLGNQGKMTERHEELKHYNGTFRSLGVGPRAGHHHLAHWRESSISLFWGWIQGLWVVFSHHCLDNVPKGKLEKLIKNSSAYW